MLRKISVRLQKLFVPDPSLVVLPQGVNTCHVFRNAVTEDEEQLIYAEVSQVLKKSGEKYITDNEGTVKNTTTEMIGFQSTTSFTRSGTTKTLFGLVWSPTLMTAFSRIPQDLFCAANNGGVYGSSRGGSGEFSAVKNPIINWVRVTEHNQPGVEMHTPMAATGSVYVYLSLLSDTVISLDDEATCRVGQVFMPQRSLMFCSHEVRWGWRIGERNASSGDVVFVGRNGVRRRVEMDDVRLGVFGYALDQRLIDLSRVTDDVSREKRCFVTEADVIPDPPSPSTSSSGIHREGGDSSLAQVPSGLESFGFKQRSEDENATVGRLGGELLPKKSKSKEALVMEAKKLSGDLRNAQFAMQDMNKRMERSEPVDNRWLKSRIGDQVNQPDQYGYDPDAPERTLENLNALVEREREKLYGMDYDNSTKEPRPVPDVTMKQAVALARKMAPEAEDVYKKMESL